MFGSSALPLPTNFASQDQHRPLRLTSKDRLPPAGACHFVLLHPSVQNQRCSCQHFHHNRFAPGIICECGHQACYHVAQPTSQEKSQESVTAATGDALLERIKRLEETIHHEREIRETALQRERSLWEREVRILREALAPFYKSEQDMRQRLVEIDDRIECNYDEQLRLKDRIVAVDDANMNMEKRVDELEQSRPKRRRISRQPVPEDVPMFSHSSDERRVSDERSVNSNSSYALSPGSGLAQLAPEREEARSSGILNLVEMTARSHLHQIPSFRSVHPRPEEARSSGFLALDLAERLGNDQDRNTAQNAQLPGVPPPPYMSFKDRYSPPGYAQSDPDATVIRRSPSFAPPGPSPLEFSPRKRKQEHMALDLLADVSMASPLIHG